MAVTGFTLAQLLDLAKQINFVYYIVAGLVLAICCISCCCLFFAYRTMKATRTVKKLAPHMQDNHDQKLKLPDASPISPTIATFSSCNSNNFNTPTPNPINVKTALTLTTAIDIDVDAGKHSESAEETKDPVFLNPHDIQPQDYNDKTRSVLSVDVDDIIITPIGSKRDASHSTRSGDDYTGQLGDNNTIDMSLNQAINYQEQWQQQMNFKRQQRRMLSAQNLDNNKLQFYNVASGSHSNPSQNQFVHGQTPQFYNYPSDSKSNSPRQNNGVVPVQQTYRNIVVPVPVPSVQSQTMHPASVPVPASPMSHNSNSWNYNYPAAAHAHRNTVAVMQNMANMYNNMQQSMQQQPVYHHNTQFRVAPPQTPQSVAASPVGNMHSNVAVSHSPHIPHSTHVPHPPHAAHLQRATKVSEMESDVISTLSARLSVQANASDITHITASTLASLNSIDFDDDNEDSGSESSESSIKAKRVRLNTPTLPTLFEQATYATHSSGPDLSESSEEMSTVEYLSEDTTVQCYKDSLDSFVFEPQIQFQLASERVTVSANNIDADHAAFMQMQQANFGYNNGAKDRELSATDSNVPIFDDDDDDAV